MLRIINCILIVSLTAAALVPAADQGMAVQASTIKDIQNQIKDTQNQLDGINDKISSLTDEQDLVQERIDDLNSEIINTMTSIGIKEDEIAAKEAEIADKQTQIDLTQQEYEAAVERERQQQEDMAVRTRLMYENSKSTYLSIFLAGDGLADILNRMDYIEKIYEYDKQKLEEYIETQNQVQALWEQLEAEKTQLESDKSGLVADREALQSQKVNLDALLAEKKQESANYDAEIKKAQQEASVAKALLQQEQEQLKKLQAQQNQANSGGSTNAANGNYTSTSYTATIDNASGSDLGKKVAKYACQYIGNPYVSGGTSLTNGADCSGFTYRVYKDFGYNLPRTSYEQRSAGAAVSYEEAQPGDLICYDGHVGIYIGGGLIVHASSVRTGIKVSNANYRTILAVRRII
nr:NlpC/P60 family protein [uncultured Acetatifactor sp.]